MDSWKEVPFGNHHFQLPFVKMSAYNPLPPRGENEVTYRKSMLDIGYMPV